MMALTEAPARTTTRPGGGPQLRLVGVELATALRRPGVRVATVVWLVQIVVFAYAINYIIYRSLGDTLAAPEAAAMIAGVLPDAAAHYPAASVPFYGLPVLVILGSLLGAGDFRTGMLARIVSRMPDRTALMAAKWATLAILTLILSALTIAVGIVCSLAVAAAEGAPAELPSLGALGIELVVMALMMAGYASLGFALAVVTRNVMAGAVVGIGWTLGVETLLVGGLAGAVPIFDDLGSVLLAPSVATLASSLDPAQEVSGVLPAIVVAAWSLLGVVVAALSFRRRDLT
jgi:ABC-2 type transport system permease protein